MSKPKHNFTWQLVGLVFLLIIFILFLVDNISTQFIIILSIVLLCYSIGSLSVNVSRYKKSKKINEMITIHKIKYIFSIITLITSLLFIFLLYGIMNFQLVENSYFPWIQGETYYYPTIDSSWYKTVTSFYIPNRVNFDTGIKLYSIFGSLIFLFTCIYLMIDKIIDIVLIFITNTKHGDVVNSVEILKDQINQNENVISNLEPTHVDNKINENQNNNEIFNRLSDEIKKIDEENQKNLNNKNNLDSN